MHLIPDPRRLLLDANELTTHKVDGVLSHILGGPIDYADIYFEHTFSESVSMEEGIVKRASRNISQGAGVRGVAGDKAGYAYSDDITLHALEHAARTARAIADSGSASAPAAVNTTPGKPHNLYPVNVPPSEVAVADKVALLREVDRVARAHDPRIVNVMASFTSQYKVVLVATSDGLVVGDVQPLSRLSVTCVAQDGSNRQIGSHGGGGRGEFGEFTRDSGFGHYAREAARQALVNLEAVEAPAGTMDVVLGSGWPGILLHEAVGHGLEADFNRKGVSAFSGMIGKRVASELCTVVDDGTLLGRRGSLNVDDEGTPTSRTVLIENGILKGYINDRMNARLLGAPLTGNGRRESYAHAPMPRMTNTFMEAGTTPPEEIIRGVRRGLYAVSFGGGQVDITNGKFVFSASEAYLIEDGKITRPVKGATLIGNGPDALTRVSAVGSDLALDSGIGTCGKEGQSVPVGVGMPTIRLDAITVGGTAA
ncbi:MAG: metalloprotease TldD [Nitrospirota bacterium]|nr:metalloprotease TldD [Nitrospirota bacterium]